MPRTISAIWFACLIYCLGFSTATQAQDETLAEPQAPVAQKPAAAPPPEEERPHIAAILPLNSPGFGRLAEAVRQGLVVASERGSKFKLPLIVYPVGDDNEQLIETYDLAQRRGARVVLGPLTKAGVQAVVAGNATTTTTLALSLPDAEAPLPEGIYAFGVQLESEARQISRLAQAQGRRKAVVIYAETPLGKRIAQAFNDEWTRAGRLIVQEFIFTSDRAALKKLKDQIALSNADMVFLALDAMRVRQIRPYLGKTLPTYATSQVHVATGNTVGQQELNGIIFVDMPWVLMPDHPAVVSYPRPPNIARQSDQDRFYALGIDAWRLGQNLLEGSYAESDTLDGVTGYIRPGNARQFVRDAIAAQFQNGVPKLLNPVSGR